MKYFFDLKTYIITFSCLMIGGANALAIEPSSFAKMPKSCQKIAPEQLTFELPLSITNLTQEQQKKIRGVLDEVRTQACILQMQYDGILQQVIAIVFEESDVVNEQLKPFYNQLASLSQNRIENKLKTILAIREIVSDKEWQALAVSYTHIAAIKNNFIKQQTELQQSYDALMSGNHPSEFTTLPVMPEATCQETNPKFKMLEQIIPTLSLTNAQEGHVRNIMRLQIKESCSAYQDALKLTDQLLQVMKQHPDKVQAKQYQEIFNQLVTKNYLQEGAQVKTLSSLFKILTSEQKMKLKEKYMLLKGVL